MFKTFSRITASRSKSSVSVINLAQALLLTWVALGIHTGVAFGARWSQSGAGLPPGAVAEVTTLVVDPKTGSTLYAQTPARASYAYSLLHRD
jgi:hypothetical protein